MVEAADGVIGKHFAMTSVQTPSRLSQTKTRSTLAAERALRAREEMANCNLCAHRCGVNRLEGPAGLCHANATARFFSAQVEVSDELELIPSFAIALSGCDLRCDFCITGASSWNSRAGLGFDAAAMAIRVRQALTGGARTVMLLGGEPTIHLPSALELVARLPDEAKLIWKTNAHGSPEACELLKGMFNVWLVDYKFGNDACARRLAKVSDYAAIVRRNLIWANQHSDLIVRHLLMPGHLECCWQPVAEWLAENIPGARVNLRSGFWPAWQAARHSEMHNAVSAEETKRATAIARDCKLNLIP